MIQALPFLALGLGAAMLRHATIHRVTGLGVCGMMVLGIGGVLFANITLATLPEWIEGHRPIVALIGLVFVALVWFMPWKTSQQMTRAPRVSKRREPMTVIYSHEMSAEELRKTDR